MTPEEKNQIKIKLFDELSKLENHITDLKELTKPIAPENSIGRISRMDAINNKSVNEAALRTAQTRFKNIKTALLKFDEPDFGICRKCNKAIPYGRLIVMPGSTTCVKCTS